MRFQSLYVLALALLCVIITAYGNACSRITNSSDSASTASQEATAKDIAIGFIQEGNGQTYDGKVFRSLVANGAVCGDGLSILTQIDFKSSKQILLTRQDCAKLLRPKIIEKGELGFPPGTPLTLIYQGETLVEYVASESKDEDEDSEQAFSNGTVDCMTPLMRLKIYPDSNLPGSVRARYQNIMRFFVSDVEMMGQAEPSMVESALPIEVRLENSSTRIEARIYNSVNILGTSLRGQILVTNRNTGKTSHSLAYCRWGK